VLNQHFIAYTQFDPNQVADYAAVYISSQKLEITSTYGNGLRSERISGILRISQSTV